MEAEMPYATDIDTFLGVLRDRSPARADAIARNKNKIENGLLSVGLKIHINGSDAEFQGLYDRLGGRQTAVEKNVYRGALARSCLVIPPFGNAATAVMMVKCIGDFVGLRPFNNRKIHIQVCSPGRLTGLNSALLGIGFYLGSDQLRRYDLSDFETTVSDAHYNRGSRMVIHDAQGAFNREFEWWARRHNGERVIKSQLPFTNGERTDIIVGRCVETDIHLINGLASFLLHLQNNAFWSDVGRTLHKGMLEILHRHLLGGLVNAPWINKKDNGPADDTRFKDALEELMAYVFTESARLAKHAYDGTDPGSRGILTEIKVLLRECSREMQSTINRLKKEGSVT